MTKTKETTTGEKKKKKGEQKGQERHWLHERPGTGSWHSALPGPRKQGNLREEWGTAEGMWGTGIISAGDCHRRTQSSVERQMLSSLLESRSNLPSSETV